MMIEHQLDPQSYSDEVFFQLHTTSDPQMLTPNDLLRMYGLNRDEVVGLGDGMGDHDQTEVISMELKGQILSEIYTVIQNTLNDGLVRNEQGISLEDWLNFKKMGGELPDFGIGPGHEFEFEEEYEKHHWLEHHAGSDPEISEWHREDVEHELLHHFHEIEHGEGDGFYLEKELVWVNVPHMFKV